MLACSPFLQRSATETGSFQQGIDLYSCEIIHVSNLRLRVEIIEKHLGPKWRSIVRQLDSYARQVRADILRWPLLNHIRVIDVK